MSVFAALHVSQELTAVCVVNQDGSIIAEAKLATCPEAITAYLERWSGQVERVGMETGPLAVWYKAVQIKSHGAYVTRALLTARDALVGMRVRLENEVRGLLKTFGAASCSASA